MSRDNSLRSAALSSRGILALVAALAAAAACVFLGIWQWDRTEDILAAERAAASEPVSITELVNEDGTWDNQNIGRPVILEGAFTSDEVLIPNREFDGQRGTWTVTRFALDDGRSIAVTRGFLPDGVLSPPILTSPTQVEGVLHPNEEFYLGANTAGSIVTVDAAALGDEWGTPLISGFVMMQEADPTLLAADAPAPVILPPTVQVGDVAFPLQNFVYAWQWWVFGAFALIVYLWWLWREVRSPERTTSS
jgi:cytochrome oxidase assembly protein ShyY1